MHSKALYNKYKNDSGLWIPRLEVIGKKYPSENLKFNYLLGKFDPKKLTNFNPFTIKHCGTIFSSKQRKI